MSFRDTRATQNDKQNLVLQACKGANQAATPYLSFARAPDMANSAFQADEPCADDFLRCDSKTHPRQAKRRAAHLTTTARQGGTFGVDMGMSSGVKVCTLVVIGSIGTSSMTALTSARVLALFGGTSFAALACQYVESQKMECMVQYAKL